jgi:hypothetical protein
MAARLITDLDAFFDGADETLQARLDAFFREALGKASTLPQFRGLFQRKEYDRLFIAVLTRDNTAAFRKFMDEFHISPNATFYMSGFGYSAPLLFLAVAHGYGFHPEIADSLLEMGVDVHAIDSHTGFNALMTAAKNGNVEGVRYLLARTEIQPSAYVFDGQYAGETAYDLAYTGYERELSVYDAQMKQIATYKKLRDTSKDVEDAASRKLRVDAYRAILKELYPFTPTTSVKDVNEANLVSTKGRLQPYRKNLLGLARRKQIPANVMKYGIGSYLTTGPRLPGVSGIQPTNTGLKHVNTSLFQKSRKRRGGRRVRKTRGRK